MFFWLLRLPEDGLEHGLKHLLVAGKWPWAWFRHLPAAGRFRLFGLFGRLGNSLYSGHKRYSGNSEHFAIFSDPGCGFHPTCLCRFRSPTSFAQLHGGKIKTSCDEQIHPPSKGIRLKSILIIVGAWGLKSLDLVELILTPSSLRSGTPQVYGA